MTDTLERIQEVAREVFSEDITEATTLRALHADPLDLVELINSLEEEFDIQIADDAAEGFQNFRQILRHVNAQVASKENASAQG